MQRSTLANVSADGLRTTFDQDAELYARARPAYPADLFAGLDELADVSAGARVVEIGPGTGQATRVLAARGAHVTAVELGPELASVLSREIADASVEVVNSAFEDWPPPVQPFDAVVAFTAWHWLDPAVRTAKAAAVLRPGGALATVTTTHVLGDTTAFFAAAQYCYLRWDPSTPPGLRLAPADEIPADLDEVDDSEQFGPAVRRRYQQDVAYTTSSYLDVLGTYPGHRALGAKRRQGLLACIAELLDREYGGKIVKRYLYELRVARKRP